jgi:hypothetical protein
MSKYKTVILAGLAVCLGLVAPISLAAPGDYTIVRSFPSPVTSPDGIELIGGYLWTTECTSEDFYKLDPVTGEVVEVLTATGAFIDHIAWDGQYLWGNDHHDRSVLLKVDPTTMTVVHTIPVPWVNLMGAAWDGEHLWTADPNTSRIHRLDPQSGDILSTFDFDFPGQDPAEQVCGLGWDGVCLWVGDIIYHKYHQVDPATGEIVLTIEAPGGPDSMPTGFTWDGRYIWIDDENPYNPTIFQLDVELNTTGPCAHGAGQGEACNHAAEPVCKDGLTCVDDGDAGGATCRMECVRGGAAECTAGYTCWQLVESSACLPDPDGGPGGNFGDTCVGSGDCQSNVCVEGSGRHVCSELCDVESTNACPNGYVCTDIASEIYACTPESKEGGCSHVPVAGGTWFPGLILLLAFLRRTALRT